MEAYEFQTISKDGIIKIPDEYKKIFNAKIKVIILAEEKPLNNKRSIFPDFTVDTTGYKFDRVEANER